MRRLPLSRWIPTAPTETRERNGGIVYAYTTLRGSFGAIAYHGKANRPDFHYSFQTEAQRDRHIEEYFLSLAGRERLIQERREQRKQPHTLQIGDIVYNSWGYEQTNIDFYQVVATSAHFVTLREIKANLTEAGYMSGKVTARPGEFLEKSLPKRHGVTMYRDEPCINFEHGAGCKWDGRPLFCSWYA